MFVLVRKTFLGGWYCIYVLLLIIHVLNHQRIFICIVLLCLQQV